LARFVSEAFTLDDFVFENFQPRLLLPGWLGGYAHDSLGDLACHQLVVFHCLIKGGFQALHASPCLALCGLVSVILWSDLRAWLASFQTLLIFPCRLQTMQGCHALVSMQRLGGLVYVAWSAGIEHHRWPMLNQCRLLSLLSLLQGIHKFNKNQNQII